MIELKEYSTEELKKILNLPTRAWKENKEEVLEYISYYFDYDVVKRGRKICYNLKEQTQSWIPYKKKNVEEQRRYYLEKTVNIIEIQPRNTGSNIARIINRNKLNKFNHKEGTISNYVRPILRKNYYSNEEDRTWCEFDEEFLIYKPLTKAQKDYLYEHFNPNQKEILDKVADYESKTITKEEVCDAIVESTKVPYKAAIKKFKEKYGFIPIRVPLWKAKAEFWEE